MSIIKNKSTPEGKAFWDHIEKVAAEVDAWPKGKKEGADATCDDFPLASYYQSKLRVEEKVPSGSCNHASVVVEFDLEAAKNMEANEVKKRWPRFFGTCPDCGSGLIKYASAEHFVYGDW